MNAIEENEFTLKFRQVAEKLPKPVAILCVSAHWETRGTKVTAMPKPRTIHDFGGFPEALFAVQYPAPGNPQLAAEIQKQITKTHVELDHEWGLDHGTWSVVKHLYPEADIPVLQLSLDYTLDTRSHYELSAQLKTLRERGVLIMGSGNMVHNLGLIDWKNFNLLDYAYDWAQEARLKMNDMILSKNHSALINWQAQGQNFRLAIPSVEHYLPLIYTLALQGPDEKPSLFNDKAVGGSLTMTSVLIS